MNSSFPKLGGGDCDSDADCEGSLTCGQDNCVDFWLHLGIVMNLGMSILDV